MNNDELAELILIAAKRKLVSEWEVDIDYFGYDVECDTCMSKVANLYRIIDKTNLEKSRQLGFIKTDFQEQVLNIRSMSSLSKNTSLYGLADEIRKYPELIFELVDKGTEVERYRMLFYLPLLEYIIPKDYNNPSFFAEEIAQIEDVAHEMLIKPVELLNYNISKKCSVKDVILFKRFFTFLSYTQQFFIEEHSEELETIAKSIVPALTKEKLIDLLKLFVGDERKATALLELYCWEGKDFLDIQSTPIIKINRCQYILVPYILTISNLVRNAIVRERKNDSQKTNSDGTAEPLEHFTKEIFDCQKNIMNHKESCKFKYEGKSGEVDVVVWSDRHLYLVECKNSILPTSPFELRTTYDYIRRAEEQLDLSCAALSDDVYKNNLLNNWKIPIKDYEIHTLILLGNRIFTSPNGFKHQVRYIYELYMILSGGFINSDFGKWRYWRDDRFSEEDFVRFISKDDPMQNDFLEAMNPYKMIVSCGEYKIERESFSLNILKHWELDDDNLVNFSVEEHMYMREAYEKNHDEMMKIIMGGTYDTSQLRSIS